MTNEMTRFNPFEELRSMSQAMDRMLGGRPRWPSAMREDVELSDIDKMLPVDIYEQDNAFVVRAALPGVAPEDVDVSINEGVLQIRAESKTESNVDEGDYHRREYRHGKWSRSFRLPTNLAADEAKAAFENGMLRLTIPYTEAATPRSIKIEVR